MTQNGIMYVGKRDLKLFEDEFHLKAKRFYFLFSFKGRLVFWFEDTVFSNK